MSHPRVTFLDPPVTLSRGTGAEGVDKSVTDRFATYEDSPLLLLGLTKCGFSDDQLTTFYAQKKDGQRRFYYKCTSAGRFGVDRCPSRNLPSKAPEDFTARLLIHTATDDEFFKAVIRQVKGNAGETLADRRQQRNGAAANHASIRKQLNMLVTI